MVCDRRRRSVTTTRTSGERWGRTVATLRIDRIIAAEARDPKEVKTKMLSNLYLRLREAMARAQEREEGQGMVEYALILVLIAIVVIVILTVVGKQVNNVFSNISNGLNQ